MNAGKKAIEWLYSTQLQVDDEWAVRSKDGFTWWPTDFSQTIEVVGEEDDGSGAIAQTIRIQTDFLEDFEAAGRNLAVLHAAIMPFASLSAAVVDPDRGTLGLCTTVRIHEDIREWMQALLGLAAALQIGEAWKYREAAEEIFPAARVIRSPHPTTGFRTTEDELSHIDTTLVAPQGQQQSQWPETDFQEAVDTWMQQYPALMATSGGPGLTVEFPHGDSSSLCEMMANQPHPAYGNGLFILQSFPVDGMDGERGQHAALELNGEEFLEGPFGYGMGSYCAKAGGLHFSTFVPNVMYTPGTIRNFYMSCAGRAQAISKRMAGDDWSRFSGPNGNDEWDRVLNKKLEVLKAATAALLGDD